MWLWLIVRSFIFILYLKIVFLYKITKKVNFHFSSGFLDPSVSSVCQKVYLSII